MAPLIEVRSANDRGASISWSPKSFADAASPTVGPVDHHVLRADARPFDEGQADAAVAARADRLEHARIGDGGGIAVALQLEFCGIDAARHVGGQHQKQIDVVGGARRRGEPGRTPAKINARRILTMRIAAPSPSIAAKDGENSTTSSLQPVLDGRWFTPLRV